jgi:hypothetical protein
MKPGSLLKIIHRINLGDPVYRETGWKLGIYLGSENFEIGCGTIKIIDSNGKINRYSTESFHFQEIE